MYPSQLGLSSNEYKYEWLRTTFVDKDGIISIIFLSRAYTNFARSIILQSGTDGVH